MDTARQTKHRHGLPRDLTGASYLHQPFSLTVAPLRNRSLQTAFYSAPGDSDCFTDSPGIEANQRTYQSCACVRPQAWCPLTASAALVNTPEIGSTRQHWREPSECDVTCALHLSTRLRPSRSNREPTAKPNNAQQQRLSATSIDC